MMLKAQIPSTKIQPKESANDDANPNTIINQDPSANENPNTFNQERIERARQ